MGMSPPCAQVVVIEDADGLLYPTTVEACQVAGVHDLHDVCPVMAVGAAQAGLEAASAGTD